MIFHTLFSWSYFWVSKCLRISQVIGFDLQNLWKTPVEEWHFASKNQLPGFNIGGVLVENGLKPQKYQFNPQCIRTLHPFLVRQTDPKNALIQSNLHTSWLCYKSKRDDSFGMKISLQSRKNWTYLEMWKTIKLSDICSILTIKWCHSGVFIVNFELTSHIILVFPLLTLNE